MGDIASGEKVETTGDLEANNVADVEAVAGQVPVVAKRRFIPPPRWVKGQSGNPAGRRKGTRNLASELIESLRKVEGKKKELFAHRLISMAWDDERLAAAVAKKFWPDLTNETGARGPQSVSIVYSYAPSPPSEPIVSTNRIADLVKGTDELKVSSDPPVLLTPPDQNPATNGS